MQIRHHHYLPLLALWAMTACDPRNADQAAPRELPRVSIERTGWLSSELINEASGLAASRAQEGVYFVHNDDGRTVIFAIDEHGKDLGFVSIVPAKNLDWEDMTSVPVEGGRWLVAGDIGDNWARRDFIKLYFAQEPRAGEDQLYAGHLELQHSISLTYPDGPRDCEAMAYDPVGNRILLLSKRDRPPRLYAVGLETALGRDYAELEFLGTISPLNPPRPSDRIRWGGRTDWISQPTGLDISPDGSEAALITYRSLYRFRRAPDEDWFSALQKSPIEVIGPDAVQNEAIAYSVDGKSIYVTTEKRPAPLHRVKFTDE